MLPDPGSLATPVVPCPAEPPRRPDQTEPVPLGLEEAEPFGLRVGGQSGHGEHRSVRHIEGGQQLFPLAGGLAGELGFSDAD